METEKTSKLNPAILKKTSMIMQLVFMVVMRFGITKILFLDMMNFILVNIVKIKKFLMPLLLVQQVKKFKR